jgi:putative heme iron utilization protein
VAFTNALPATTTETLTTPDGKWTYTFSATTTTTVSVSVASPDKTTITSDSGATIYDSLNTWGVAKGVIQFNGALMAGTNNVAKLVWTAGLIYQTNGSLWWHWDDINEIWVSGAAPV